MKKFYYLKSKQIVTIPSIFQLPLLLFIVVSGGDGGFVGQDFALQSYNMHMQIHNIEICLYTFVSSFLPLQRVPPMLQSRLLNAEPPPHDFVHGAHRPQTNHLGHRCSLQLCKM
jgi:hypothetical protein